MAHALGRAGLVGALLLGLCASASGAPGQGAPQEEQPGLAAELDALWPLRDQAATARSLDRRIEEALDASPDDPELLWRAARWRLWRSQITVLPSLRSLEAHEAWLLAERALRLAPDSLPVRYWAALSAGGWGETMGVVAALRQGIERKFRENLEYVLRRDPNYDAGLAMTALGRYYHQLPWPKRDKRRAFRCLKAAIEANPTNLTAKVFLAELLAEGGAGGARQASGLIAEVLAAEPSGPHAPEQRRAQRLARELGPRIKEKLK